MRLRGKGWIHAGLLGAAVALAGCGELRTKGNPALLRGEAADAPGPVADLTHEAEAYADSVVRTLSLRERAGMIFMPAVFARDDADNLRLIQHYTDSLHVGGIVLLKGTLPAVAEISERLRECEAQGRVRPFLAVDAENGLRMRFPDAPEFPWSRELGRINDGRLLYEFGVEIARECRVVGIDMVLGPVMDVVPGDAEHGLMRRRSLGGDPARVAELAMAYARGLEDGSVISVAKHFPGHGSANADSHKALGEIRSSREYIDSVDLYPFRRYAEEGLTGVMVGHLSVIALDSLRRPAVVSPRVMGDVLRGELGFHGLIITDALNMEGALGVKGWEAVAAGADMVIAPTDTRGEIEAMLRALDDGRLSVDVLDDRCRRQLFYKFLLNYGGRPGAAPGNVVEEVGSSQAALMRDSIISALGRHRNSIRQPSR